MRIFTYGLVVLTTIFSISYTYSHDYWETIGPNGGGIFVVETHPADSTLVFCASQDHGFFLSTNQGLDWEARRSGLYGFWCRCIEPHPINSEIIYIGGNYLYKTTDWGITWTPAADGLEGGSHQIVYSIAAEAKNDTIVYAGTFYGLYKSTNGGDYWHETSLSEWVWDVEIDRSNSSILYAATKYGVFMSTDYGESWELKTDSLEITTFWSITQDPSDSMKLYATGGSEESNE